MKQPFKVLELSELKELTLDQLNEYFDAKRANDYFVVIRKYHAADIAVQTAMRSKLVKIWKYNLSALKILKP